MRGVEVDSVQNGHEAINWYSRLRRPAAASLILHAHPFSVPFMKSPRQRVKVSRVQSANLAGGT